MKKIIIVTNLLLFASFCYSQLNVSEDIRRTVLIIRKYKYNGRDSASTGSGFIIDNKYLATCMHVFRTKEETPVEMKVLYNLKPVNGLPVYDSCYVDIDNSSLQIGTRCDFRGKYYDRNDLYGDFVILKLKESIDVKTPEIDTSLNQNDNDYFFAFGFTSNEKYASPLGAQLALAFNFRDTIFHEINYYAMVGLANHGFSGSPIFNNENKVIGIITQGWDNYESLEPTLIANKVSGNIIQKIKRAYSLNNTVSLCIPINVIYALYLRHCFTNKLFGLK